MGRRYGVYTRRARRFVDNSGALMLGRDAAKCIFAVVGDHEQK